MELAELCVACGGDHLRSKRASVAPFVAERVWSREPFETELLTCSECGMTFYRVRPDDDEMARLYGGYRDSAYQEQREKYEPDYTPQRNAEIGGDIEIEQRSAYLGRMIATHVKVSSVRSVLDFGGDRGQFIPKELASAAKYVYDVSGVEPIAEVTRLPTIADVMDHDYDLVLCCMVLEHVSIPRGIVHLLRKVGHDGTRFYFEVPQDSPVFAPSQRLAPDAPLRTRVKARVQEIPGLYNGYLRLRGAAPAHTPPVMHEHINHFTPESLSVLLEREGFRIDHLSSTAFNLGWGEGSFLSCIAH